MGATAGFNAKMGIGTTSTVDQPLDFLNEGVACNENFIDRAGIRGTREHPIEVTRVGLRRIEGPISMAPTAVEWSYLLPWILGADASGTTYALAETLQARYLTVDRSDANSSGTDGKVFTYDGCKVNRARIHCAQGELLGCDLDIVGIDETVANNGTFPAITLDITTGPFTFSDSAGALSLGGSAYSARSLEIVIDNKIDTERFFNSNTRTAVVAQDREILVNMELGYGDAEAIYNSGIGGLAGTFTFTNGAVSIVFTFPKIQFPRRSPTVRGKQEVMLGLQGRAHRSGSTPSLSVDLDSTP
jgi:hypothetical protein